MAVFLVALGGAVGTALRYLLSLAGAAFLPAEFPFATLGCNALGSLLLGALTEAGAGHELLGVDLRVVLGVGVLGGFTTYSSFAVETIRLVDNGTFGRAILYATLTTVLCFAAAASGVLAVRRFF